MRPRANERCRSSQEQARSAGDQVAKLAAGSQKAGHDRNARSHLDRSLGGWVFVGVLMVIAVSIRVEEVAAMRRLDGLILLHDRPKGRLLRDVRRLSAVGQRDGRRQLSGDERN